MQPSIVISFYVREDIKHPQAGEWRGYLKKDEGIFLSSTTRLHEAETFESIEEGEKVCADLFSRFSDFVFEAF